MRDFVGLWTIASEVTLIQHTSKIALLWATQSETLVSAARRARRQIGLE
jgi:hypothetical protein